MQHSFFQEKLRAYLTENSVSLSELSRSSGISRQTLSRILNERQGLHLSTAVKIAQALNVSFIYLNSVGNYKPPDSFDPTVTAAEYLDIAMQNLNMYTLRKTHKSLSTSPGLSEAEISNLLTGKVTDPYMSSLEYLISNAEFNDLAALFQRR